MYRIRKKLGFKLFIRKSQPIKFTIQGNILLQLSEEILPKIEKTIQKCTNSYHTVIRLTIKCHSCIQWLTPALKISQKQLTKGTNKFLF